MQNRIDVIPEMARAANATAQAASVPSGETTAVPPPVAPSMFEFMATTLVSNSLSFEAARLALLAHLEAVDRPSTQAVVAYEITNEDNARSLSPITEV